MSDTNEEIEVVGERAGSVGNHASFGARHGGVGNRASFGGTGSLNEDTSMLEDEEPVTSRQIWQSRPGGGARAAGDAQPAFRRPLRFPRRLYPTCPLRCVST